MKKLLIVFIIAMVVVTMSACSKSKVTENSITITVEEPAVTISLRQAYDLLGGIKALDQKNNDITAQIKMNTNGFTPFIEGVYTIEYYIEDDQGKRFVNVRTIEVINPDDLLDVPTLSNPDGLVVNFKNFSFSYQEIYQTILPVKGLQSLLSMIHLELLKPYEAQLDGAIVNETIEEIKSSYNEEQWLNILLNVGIYQGTEESNEAFEARIFDYFKITFLEQLAAKERALNSITNSQIETAKQNYKEDVCAINLSFALRAEAQAFVNTLNGLTKEQIKAMFVHEFQGAQVGELNTLNQFTCDYDLFVHNQTTNAHLKSLVFDALIVDDYNIDPLAISGRHHVVYKVAVANPKQTYDVELFENKLKDQLATNMLTAQYVHNTMIQLRQEANFKIYDERLARQYRQMDAQFEVTPRKDSHTIASIHNQDITTDELLAYFNQRYVAPLLIEQVDQYLLLSIEDLFLTNEQQEQIAQTIQNLRQQYANSQFREQFTFNEFIYYYYEMQGVPGVIGYLEFSMLAQAYVLGNDHFSGINPVTLEQIEAAYDEYFNVRASHILIQFENETERQVAYLKVQQIIRGVNDGEEAHIFLGTNVFNGLENISPDLVKSNFATLAQQYSKDPGSAVQGGDLGFFTSYMMVKPFEEGIKTLITQGVNSYTIVESEFGYHVILLTDIGSVTQKPAGYDDFTPEELLVYVNANPTSSERAYYQIINNIIRNITNERMTYEAVMNEIVKLRNEHNFAFLDEFVQNHYLALNQ